MAFAFDTLGYTKRLETSGIDRPQAEAHAEAAREFIMTELVTRADLAAVETRFRDALNRQSLQMTVRMGSIMTDLIAAAVAVLGLLIRFH